MSKYVVRDFSMPQKISDLINTLAKSTGMNASELVREAVRHYSRYIKKQNGNN